MKRSFLRTFTGAFHDYMRGVFADRSTRASRVQQARALWLRDVAQRTTRSPAEQRWEGEGGSIR